MRFEASLEMGAHKVQLKRQHYLDDGRGPEGPNGSLLAATHWAFRLAVLKRARATDLLSNNEPLAEPQTCHA